ncbi:MAG: OmpA family protein [Pseudomonadota bacterium]
MKTPIHTAAIAAFVATASPVAALTLDYAAPVLAQAQTSAALSSYAMPIGPFARNAMQTRAVEGAVDSRALRLDAPGATTLQLLAPLRDQLVQAGYRIVYECAAFECGGYDFRYGTEVLPEPDMHVDLGDYRFLAAERAGTTDAVTLLVSRSSQAGYVQVVAVTPGAVVPDLTASTKSPAPAAPQVRVLEDLVFASGAAVLSSGHYPSIRDLVATLQADPAAEVTLLGHTDATGPLAANLAISQQRAEAVKAALVAGGIAPDRIVATGMGPKSPRAGNDTEEGRRQNRRVEAVITAP